MDFVELNKQLMSRRRAIEDSIRERDYASSFRLKDAAERMKIQEKLEAAHELLKKHFVDFPEIQRG